jgi:hypothetical protein
MSETRVAPQIQEHKAKVLAAVEVLNDLILEAHKAGVEVELTISMVYDMKRDQRPVVNARCLYRL